jgi:hypothetical protein
MVRGLIYVGVWFSVMEEHELKFMRNTRKGWEDVYLGKRKRGGGWADYRINIRLPVSLKEGGAQPRPSARGGGTGRRPYPN